MKFKRIILAAAGAAILISGLLLADKREAVIELKGEEYILHSYGEEFKDPGCAAYTEGRIFGRGRELELRSSGAVDCNEEGEYSLSYTADYRGKSYTAERRVQVKDREAPIIKLNHKEGYEPSWFEGYEEEGFEASDNKDGDLSGQVILENYPDRLIYEVTDKAGNKTELERSSSFSDTAPKIILNGQQSMDIYACPEFTDPGFSAFNQRGDELSEKINVESNLIPYRPGSYDIKYFAENARGQRIESLRHINVLSSGLPEIQEPEKGTIYLSFDDGPGPYTEELLDLLKEYGVKATFFVTCNQPAYNDMVGRASREGHSIGAHSASHNINSIYTNLDKYLEDLSRVERMIYEQTGEYSKLIRFPGGSRTARGFGPFVFKELKQIFTDMGCRYYDWNVSTQDAGKAANMPELMVSNAIEGFKTHDYTILLSHDINPNCVKVTERIIKWGLENGYKFAALELKSPTAAFNIQDSFS